MTEEDQVIDLISIKPVSALEFVLSMRPAIPQSQEGDKIGPPSNGEIRRWLQNGAVQINGKKPKSTDIVEFPVKELIFFPKNEKKRATVYKEN